MRDTSTGIRSEVWNRRFKPPRPLTGPPPGKFKMQPTLIGNVTLYCGDCLEILPSIRKKLLDQAETTVPLEFIPVYPK